MSLMNPFHSALSFRFIETICEFQSIQTTKIYYNWKRKNCFSNAFGEEMFFFF